MGGKETKRTICQPTKCFGIQHLDYLPTKCLSKDRRHTTKEKRQVDRASARARDRDIDNDKVKDNDNDNDNDDDDNDNDNTIVELAGTIFQRSRFQPRAIERHKRVECQRIIKGMSSVASAIFPGSFCHKRNCI
jgi:hypothetical protein